MVGVAVIDLQIYRRAPAFTAASDVTLTVPIRNVLRLGAGWEPNDDTPAEQLQNQSFPDPLI
jgi:hypothetical protein